MAVKTKILIVDDEPVNLFIIQQILATVKSEYIYRVAYSGEDALLCLTTFRPDIILLDVCMPGMSGYELCKIIRSDPHYKSLKVMMVSGKTSLEERLEGYQAGADDYITKPFDEEELLAKIKVFKQLKRTEEVDRIKSDMLRLFSHEIRTPLNGIFMASQVFQMDTSLNVEQRQMVEVVINSSNQLLDFIEKATFLCELKGNVKLDKTYYSVASTLESVIYSLSQKASEKEVVFIMNCDKTVQLDADWFMMSTAFKSVLDNAIKYSPKGGTVAVSCQAIGDDCVISIKDDGTGIDPNEINDIIDGYAIKDLDHHHKGLGFSLAIARLIMENHGGSMDIISGEGTTIIFKLPNCKQ